jgi:SpoVK/Ycf46/Vps4 family AAA+-type ATPase
MKPTKTNSVEKLLTINGRKFYIANQKSFEEPDRVEAGVYVWAPAGMGEISDSITRISSHLDIGKNSVAKNAHYAQIKMEVEKLVKNQDWFKKIGSSCRRGFLLHGPAGTGKTTIQKMIVNNIIDDFNAIVFEVSLQHDLYGIVDYISKYRRRVEPNRLVIFSFGDLNATELRGGTLNMFREFLETHQEAATIYLATTNEFDRIDKSVVCRPGRFDKRIFIDKMEFEAFKGVCKFFYIEDLAEKIYAISPTVTPAILKEISVRINCFEMDGDSAIATALEEFEAVPSDILLSGQNDATAALAKDLRETSKRIFGG